MKFICLAGGETSQEILKSEYKAAERFGEVRLGEFRLFYRYFIRVRYIDYGEVTRVYLRQESGESGEFLLLENYLMIEAQDGSLHKMRMEREVCAKEVLSALQGRCPSIKIGYNRLGRSK